MLKQIGRIYNRDSSKSPTHHRFQQTVQIQKQNVKIQQVITIRKQSTSFNMVSLQYSKNKKYEETSRRASKFQSIRSQKSKPFSSIRQSSLLSIQQSVCLTDSKFSLYGDNRDNKKEVNNESDNQSKFADSLAIYQNPVMKNNEIVKKLSHLNNIFKQIKVLRNEQLNRQIISQINEAERDLIEVERDILRTC